MTHLWAPVRLFPPPLLPWPSGSEWQGGRLHTGFRSPTLAWLPLNAQSTSSKDRPRSPSMALFSEVISQRPGDRLITFNHFHQGRGSTLFFQNRYSEYRFAFPVYHMSIKTTIWTLAKREQNLPLLSQKK